jgi:hypothetical protein
MTNPEMGQVYEGEQPSVEQLRGDIERWTASNQTYQELIEMAK